MLDDSTGSVTLTERGDTESLDRNPNFRLFAAMNPATDAGKKELPSSIRSRFTELYVDELVDANELRKVAARYLAPVISSRGMSVEHSETVTSVIDTYLKCRELSFHSLIDGSGQRPRYTLRTLCRALDASQRLARQQKLNLNRGILEGFLLSFGGPLDENSSASLLRLLRSELVRGEALDELEHPGRRPGGRDGQNQYALVKPFWIKAGPSQLEDWSDESNSGRPLFVLTNVMRGHLRRLARTVAAGPWPVLLEGPTSAGKTTLVEYLAARCGHKVIRINNHEHTGRLRGFPVISCFLADT